MHGRKNHFHDAKGRTAIVIPPRQGNLWIVKVRGTDGALRLEGRYRSAEAAYGSLRAAGCWQGVPGPGEE